MAQGVGFGCSFTVRLSRGTAGNFVTENIGWGLALVFAVITAGGVSGVPVKSLLLTIVRTVQFS